MSDLNVKSAESTGIADVRDRERVWEPEEVDDAFCAEANSRTAALFGKEAVGKLAASRVIVFGAGGVGGYVIEVLARSGVGEIAVVDDDRVSVSNLNRQILATRETIGREKVEVAAERIRSINPRARVKTYSCFVLPENIGGFDFLQYDYAVDAIDTVSGKLAIVTSAVAAGVPVISCMGAGNKLDPSGFRVADLSKTSVCPLARVMRTELRKRGILHIPVVYSEELPARCAAADPGAETGKDRPGNPKTTVPGSCAFVPAAAGLVLAGKVIRDLCMKDEK